MCILVLDAGFDPASAIACFLSVCCTCSTPSFLECICRFATLKALPTDADLSSLGEGVDAGSYLIGLQSGENPNEHREYMRNHRMAWGEEPIAGYPQLARRIEHLIHLIVRLVARGSGFKLSEVSASGLHVYGDGVLSRKEVDKWTSSIKWESE